MLRNQRENLTEESRFSSGPNGGRLYTTRRDQIMIVRSIRKIYFMRDSHCQSDRIIPAV